MSFKIKDLKKYMQKAWDSRGEKLPKGHRLGLSITEIIKHSKLRHKKLDTHFIDLWIGILDELHSWIFSLFSTVYDTSEERDPLNDFERSVVLILGKLAADTTAFRHLIELGFDSAARTVLRSIIEYIQVLIAILDDPNLAKEFVKANTPESSNEFYFQNIARKKITNRIKTALIKFFDDDVTAKIFLDQQNEILKLLAGTSHPSFSGGELSVMHFIELENDEKWLGLFGAKSNISVFTIDMYAQNFLFLLLLSNFPFEGYEKWLTRPINYDERNEMHRHVKHGRAVLASLILSLRKEENIPLVFPKDFEPQTPDIH